MSLSKISWRSFTQPNEWQWPRRRRAWRITRRESRCTRCHRRFVRRRSTEKQKPCNALCHARHGCNS